MIATTDKYLALKPLAYHLKKWLKGRGWTIHSLKEGAMLRFRARRSHFDVDDWSKECLLEVDCYHEGSKTKVLVKKFGWDEDLRNNLGWVLLTGGTDMSGSHRPFVVCKAFMDYVEEILQTTDNEAIENS